MPTYCQLDRKEQTSMKFESTEKAYKKNVIENVICKMLVILFRLQVASHYLNSLAPGKCGCYLKLMIFKLVSRINVLSILCEIVIR